MQAARGEVHVAGTQATEMSRAEMRDTMGALEQRAQQTWTSHQVILFAESNSVAGDALEIREETYSLKQIDIKGKG